MSDFSKYCENMNCPFIRMGFSLDQEGFERFQALKRNCDYSWQCSYVDDLEVLFEEKGFKVEENHDKTN